MRSVTALEVRKRFGQIVDEAAAGERIVIERAGQPIAALVPLSDLALSVTRPAGHESTTVDPERRKAEQLAALDEIRELARRRTFQFDVPAEELVGRMRRERGEQIDHSVREAVDQELYRAIRVEAARMDRSVREVVDEALAAWLERAEEEEDRASAATALEEYRRDGGEAAEAFFGKLAADTKATYGSEG